MYVQLFSSLCAIMRVEVELTSGKRIPPAMVPQHPLPECDIRMRPYPWFPLIPPSARLCIAPTYRETIYRSNGAY
jgi:hypothetical protein